ncbi:MAG TPA: SURF1 family protein [Alphaproteobacteria bacterium]
MPAASPDRAARRARNPAWLAWPAIALLVGLGSWQLQRAHWKEALIATMEARLAAPPIALPERLDAAAVEALGYRRILLRGRFLHSREMLVAPRTYQGRVGAELVTPFETEDGRVVLVDRGWVPDAAMAPARRPESRREGTVAFEGVVRPPPSPNPFTPANDPAHGAWYWIDPQAMARAAGIAPLPFTIAALAGEGGGGALPLARPARIELRNAHLYYALTWYALAVALGVVYLLFRRGARRA